MFSSLVFCTSYYKICAIEKYPLQVQNQKLKNQFFPTLGTLCAGCYDIPTSLIVDGAIEIAGPLFISFHFIFIYLGTVAPSVHENCLNS